MNVVMIDGRLVRDVEMRVISTGGIANFSVAVNNPRKKDDVYFASIKAFGTLAETCGKYIQKGSHVLIRGRLTRDAWTAKDGTNREKTVIIADEVQFLSPRNAGTEEHVQQKVNGYAPQYEPSPPVGDGWESADSGSRYGAADEPTPF